MTYDPSLEWRDIKGRGFQDLIGPIQLADLPGGDLAFALQLDDRHTNANGVCHGGVLMSVADSSMGSCAFASAGRPVATIDFECDFLAAAKIGTMLYGTAKVARRARNFIFMEADLHAGERRVLRASGIWAVLAENSGARDTSRLTP